MPGYNWREGQGQVRVLRRIIGTEAAADGGDWRTQLPPGSRHKIVNNLLDTMKNHPLCSGKEGLSDLAAVRFEECVFATATSKSEYFEMLSLKLLGDEVEYKPGAPQNNAASSSRISQHPASLDSSSQMGSASGGDWKEEIFQKIRAMDVIYRPELNELYQRLATKLLERDTLHPHLQPNNAQLEKLRFLMIMLERLIKFLRTKKDDIQPNHKEKTFGVGNQIINILNSSRPRRPVSSLQEGQLSQPHTYAMRNSQQQQPQMSQHTNGSQSSS